MLAAHGGEHSLARIKDAHQIRIEDTFPFVKRGISNGAPIEDADVVDEHVETLEAIEYRTHERLRALRVCGIGFDGEAFASYCLELAQSVLRRRLIRAIGKRDARAFASQAQSDAFADAPAATRDQSHALSEFHEISLSK